MHGGSGIREDGLLPVSKVFMLRQHMPCAKCEYIYTGIAQTACKLYSDIV